MKGLIIRIVEVVCIIHSSSAKKDDVIPFKLKIYVLKAHFVRVCVAVINQVAHNAPILHILA